jgi:hypothetical protein
MRSPEAHGAPAGQGCGDGDSPERQSDDEGRSLPARQRSTMEGRRVPACDDLGWGGGVLQHRGRKGEVRHGPI